MKACSDCKHWRPRIGPFGLIKSPHPHCAKVLDTQGRREYAEIARMGLVGPCGPDALFFEPKRGAS